jgi:hypothetical protein
MTSFYRNLLRLCRQAKPEPFFVFRLSNEEKTWFFGRIDVSYQIDGLGRAVASGPKKTKAIDRICTWIAFCIIEQKIRDCALIHLNTFLPNYYTLYKCVKYLSEIEPDRNLYTTTCSKKKKKTNTLEKRYAIVSYSKAFESTHRFNYSLITVKKRRQNK